MVLTPSLSELQSSSPLSTATSLSKREDDVHLYVVMRVFRAGNSYNLYKINLTDMILRFNTSSPLEREKPWDLEPILKLPYPKFTYRMEFFAVGSKIYVFGSEKPIGPDNNPMHRCSASSSGTSRRGGSPCYVFETCKNRPFYGTLKKGPSLNFKKYGPIVAGPMMDGKFYALSYNLAYRDLEEFDPATERWLPLPQPPAVGTIGFRGPPDDYAVVGTHCTADNRLVMVTEGKGVYAYNVLSDTWEVGNPIIFDCFWYNPCRGLNYVEARVSDDGKEHHCEVYPVSGLERKFVKESPDHYLLLPVKDENNLFVVSYGGAAGDPRPSSKQGGGCLAVDLCHLSTKPRTNRQVLDHCHGTYSLPIHGDEKINGIVSCFLI